jgi:CubicO group peptidase (beta-lactamase class C family)/dephospho-CoA kinase
MPKIVLLIGPSSAGKTTLCGELQNSHQWQVISQDDVNEELWAKENKQDQINERANHEKLMQDELRRQNLFNELSPYMTEKEVLQLCAEGTLTFSEGSHRQGDTRVVTHQFESPNFKNIPALMKKLTEAGFSKKELYHLSDKLLLVSQVPLLVRKSLPDKFANSIVNKAFANLDNLQPSIVDMVPPADDLIKLFNQRAAEYNKIHLDKPIEIIPVLAHCSPEDLSKRVLSRNKKAEENNDLMNLREGTFPFHQLSHLVSAEKQDNLAQTPAGFVSKVDLLQLSYKHPGRIAFIQSSKAPEAEKVNLNEYYLIKDMEKGSWQIHYKSHKDYDVMVIAKVPSDAEISETQLTVYLEKNKPMYAIRSPQGDVIRQPIQQNDNQNEEMLKNYFLNMLMNKPSPLTGNDKKDRLKEYKNNKNKLLELTLIRKHTDQVQIINQNEFKSTKGLEDMGQALARFDTALGGRKPEDMQLNEFIQHAGDIRKILLSYHTNKKGKDLFMRAGAAAKESVALAKHFELPNDVTAEEKIPLVTRRQGFDFTFDTTSAQSTPEQLAKTFLGEMERLKSRTGAQENSAHVVNQSHISGTARLAKILAGVSGRSPKQILTASSPSTSSTDGFVYAPTTAPSPQNEKPRIFVLRNEEGVISAKMQSRLNSLPKNTYEIEYQNEPVNAVDLKPLAKKINDGKFDLVLIDENTILPAWELIDNCKRDNTNKNPKFYIEGDVSHIIDRQFKHSHYSGTVRIDKVDKTGNPITLLRQGYGDSNRSSQHTIKNQADTKICIGSATKMFTAASIVKLVEENIKTNENFKHIQDPYHTKLIDLLPVNYPHKEIFKDFTLHELLTHTSGILGGIEDPFFKTDMLDVHSLEHFLPWMKSQEVLADGGIEERRKQNKFYYSNAGILLIGFAIEAISGMSYYEYVQNNIFTPLGMDNTQFLRTDASSLMSIAYTKRESFPTKLEVEALQELNLNAELQTISQSAKDMIKKADEIVTTNHPAAEKIIARYESSLLHISTLQDKDAFNKFKGNFKEELKNAYEEFIKAKADAEEMKKIDVKLNEWINSNSSAPGVEDAKKLSDIMKKVVNNLEWPVEVMFSIIINLSISHPAAKLFSTVDDITKFQQALWSNDGLLSMYKDRLLQESVSMGPDSDNRYAYGVQKINGGIGHFGGAGGARAGVFYYPEQQITLTTLANDDYLNRQGSQMTYELEENLVHRSDKGIEYFDPRITPNAEELLIQDITRIQALQTDIRSASQITHEQMASSAFDMASSTAKDKHGKAWGSDAEKKRPEQVTQPAVQHEESQKTKHESSSTKYQSPSPFSASKGMKPDGIK